MNTHFLEARNARDRQRRQDAAMRSTAPVVGILDPRFQYVTHQHTDIRKTFERARRGELSLPLKAKP